MFFLYKFRQAANLLGRCSRALEGQHRLVALFIVLSLLAAIMEGLGVSLLLPFLEDGKAASVLHDRPVFGPLLAFVDSLPEETRLTLVAVTLGGVVLLRGILMFLVQVLSNWLPLNLQLRLRNDAYGALLNVEMGYLSQSQVGPINDAIANLPVRISSVVMHVTSALFNLTLAMAYTALMFAVSPSLTVTSLTFFGIITLVLKKFFSTPLLGAGRLVTETNANVSGMIHETINGLRLVRLSSAEQVMYSSFAKQSEGVNAATKHIQLIRSIPSPVLSTTAGIAICLLLMGGGVFFAGEKEAWITSVLMFNIMILRLLSPISGLNEAWHYILSDIDAFDKYDHFLKTMRDNFQRSGKRDVTQVEQGVRLENVTFTYPGSTGSVLKDVTLDAPMGSMIALVGHSGSGKSTIAALLSRLYDPDAGRVLVDGVDLRELDITQWHKQLGFVSQDTFVFNDTLANNMRFVRQDATDDEIHEALRRAEAAEFVKDLPVGLETMLGQRGARLSGGQLQRIALARVILSDPRVIILDEATSALDSLTEISIQNTIEELRQDHVIIAIAHRLSTIFRADNIVVLKEGAIYEQGTHQSLQQKGGLYNELLSHQSHGMLV